jgi:hypothetical protein
MGQDLTAVQIPVTPPWSASAGDGSATVDSVITVGLAQSVTPSSWAQVPKATLAHGRSFMALDVRARLSSVTGGNDSNVYASLRICQSGSVSTGLLANLRMNGGSLALDTVGVSGGGRIGSISTPTRANITSGNLWLRVVFAGLSVTVLWGLGSGGAEPTDWQIVATSTNATSWSSGVFASVCVALDTAPGGSPDAVTVEWSDVSVRGLW